PFGRPTSPVPCVLRSAWPPRDSGSVGGKVGWAWAVVVFPRVYHPARVFDRAAACCPLPPVGLPCVGPVLGPLDLVCPDLVCPDLDCPGPACPDLGFCPDLDFYPGPDPSDPDLRPACPVVAVVALPAFFWPG